MIRLSRLADYGVILVCRMSLAPGEVHSARFLSEETGISEPAIMKILKLLAKADLITSVRGAKGGYILESNPSEVSILSVVKAVDGPIAVTKCSDEYEVSCEFQNDCVAQCGWNKVNSKIQASLADFSIEDFMHE